ncbi:hypothetical protein MS3_00007427 [Schistosoma haematobium]|uniref:BHLH domain-containing protein n=1 Tax=Schistosoma haematobium TaxID=6185 RepID=A0A922IM49_SCHHA|nr:hypothetical protein MS3_00007427 [Schistosoma haematobium]KAH9582791.1 hypothetical protein MS3_00007427 [Schistosoma haematobium]
MKPDIMSRNCIGNLSPIQRKLLTKRRCQSTFKPLSGLNKNIRKRTYLKRLNDNNSLKPHQIECERLREILPTVANCENLDEVKIIQEAIKHINYLEQAVLRRLNIINVETSIENSNLHSSSLSSSSLLPAFIFKLLSSQNNPSQSIPEENLLFHANTSYHNRPQLNNNYITDDNFLSKSYEYLNSNGSTPYQTDDDIDQLG